MPQIDCRVYRLRAIEEKFLPLICRMEQHESNELIEEAHLRLSLKHTQDPPRNKENQIYCEHPDCTSAKPTFRRPCDWSKHIDKHDRPYKCHEPGCEKVKGFTYCGGLKRHQQEVHKAANSKTPLVYPYDDCNRHVGKPFSRQENLREHLRRRHQSAANFRPSNAAQMRLERNTSISNTRKKRKANSLRSGALGEIERLRQEIEKKRPPAGGAPAES